MKYLFSILLFAACSSQTTSQSMFEPYEKSYKFTDLSGDFSLWTEAGKKTKREVFYKRKLVGTTNNLTFEKTITISEMGSIKFKNARLNILRPKISQHSVWFDKKKFFVQQEVEVKNKRLKITMSSPEPKWNGVKYFNFPSSRGVFCFTAQLVDCVAMTGFFKKAVKANAGKMALTLIWESFPYASQQYEGIYKTPFIKANLTYDKKSKDGHYVFNLEFNNQNIFYHLNDKFLLEKKFWISQGLTQISY